MRSNSLVKIICQTEARLLKLARRQRYQEGLETIGHFNRKYGPVNEILIQKAFFLYHYAAALMYGDTKTSRQNYVIRKNYHQALIICREIIRKRRNDTRDKNTLNARLYLAQIYAMIGQEKRARRFAKQTFKYQLSALAAERAADVYFRTGDMVGAAALYREAEKKAEDPAQKLMAQIGLAVTYKRMGKTVAATKQARIASMFLKQADKNINTTLLGESLRTNFPNLNGP